MAKSCLRSEPPLTRGDVSVREDEDIVLFLIDGVNTDTLGLRQKAPEKHPPEPLNEVLLRNGLLSRDGVGAVLLGNSNLAAHFGNIVHQPVQIILDLLGKRPHIKHLTPLVLSTNMLTL